MSGNRTLYGDDRTYPKGLTDIPLASYFKITRYQYNDGLKNARESGQNDASTGLSNICLLYTSPSPRDKRQSRMPSSA